MADEKLRPLRWIGSSRRDLRAFPPQVRLNVGYALYAAQNGEIDPAAKPIKGLHRRLAAAERDYKERQDIHEQ